MEIATAVGTSMAEKTVTAAVDGIWQQIRYVLDYSDNLKDLRMKLQALKDARDRVLHQVEDAAKRLEEQIESDVQTWLNNVDGEIAKVEKILVENDEAEKICCIGLLPNVKNRYNFSKQAKLEATAAKTLAGEGKFDKVARRGRLPTVVSVHGYMAFESRGAVFESIIKALRVGDVDKVGVWGLGGVGKTTLAKKIAQQVQAEGIFMSVAFAEVSTNPNLKKIQSDIAGWLDFQFEADRSLEVRASQLQERLKQEKSVLVILDNVWENIELDEIGIPISSDKKACRILITSRNEEVLHEMGALKQSRFHLDALTGDEARKLFDKTVGSVEDPAKQQVAAEIVRRCAGLPILILPVAAALKQKEKLYRWKNALQTLKTFDNQHITAKAYAALELSYSALDEEAKSLFLLCAQFAPINVDIRFLLPHCMGWGLFPRCKSLEATRNRVLEVINAIKSASLLLEGTSSDTFRMHDVVYSFAFFMLSKKQEPLILKHRDRLEEWPAPDILQNCTSIFLPFCKIPKLPLEPECPELICFSLWGGTFSPGTIPNNFFLRMKKLRLLHLCDMNLSPLPSSLQLLASLRALYLTRCILGDISMIGEFRNLQVLCLESCGITHFPKEMAKLTCLQLLYLRECGEIKVIPPNVLSFLTQLEELYMGDSFTAWGLKDEAGQNINADLDELKSLENLNTLEIQITDVNILPYDLFSNKLERFFIIIGDCWKWDWSRKEGISRTLKLKLNASIRAVEKVNVLVKKTEDLCLDSYGGTDIDLLQLDGDFLKNLHLRNCHELRYLINSVQRSPCTVFARLEKIRVESCDGLIQLAPPSASFNNLTTLKVWCCEKLTSLFTCSTAASLKQLRKLEIISCNMMGEIVAASANESETEISFDKLEILRLINLGSITSFCPNNCPLKFEMLVELIVSDCPKMECFSPVQLSAPKLKAVQLTRWGDRNSWKDDLNATIHHLYMETQQSAQDCIGSDG